MEHELRCVSDSGARSSLDPASGRYVKAAAAPSLVSEEQWRQLQLGVFPAVDDSEKQLQRNRDSVKQRPLAMLN